MYLINNITANCYDFILQMRKKMVTNWRKYVTLTLDFFVQSCRYLIKFLAKLSEYQDSNKMTPGNMAIVLGPNLLWTQTEPYVFLLHHRFTKCWAWFARKQDAIFLFLGTWRRWWPLFLCRLLASLSRLFSMLIGSSLEVRITLIHTGGTITMSLGNPVVAMQL